MKIVIYTAIFGGYDTLKEQPSYADVDYICYSDTPKLTSRSWKVVPCRTLPEHGRTTAKRFKTTPQHFLPKGYDVSIWIDGSMVLVGPEFPEKCICSLGKWGIACMLHPVGNCIYQEAKGCYQMPKYKSQPILLQSDHYRKEGYPEGNGLAACGIVVRDLRSAALMAKLEVIGESWMKENLRWSYQDQISFPYVLWKHDHWFDKLDIDYRDRSTFVLCNHLNNL